MNNFTLVDQIGKKIINLLLEGDNLPIMKEIIAKFAGGVDLIYIDPPYNTGKTMGKYDDNYHDHDSWVNFIQPRLELAKEFLSDNGMIFISIGENEEAYLKILCNKIFGEKNKLSPIIWQCNYTVSNDKSGISCQTEHILVYAKNINNIKINNDPLREEYVKSMYRNPDKDPRGLWRGGVQLFKKKNKHSFTVTSPTGKKWTMPWNYSEDTWYSKLEKNKLIYWGADGNSCPVKKVFLKNSKGIPIKNLWLGEDVGYTADGGETLEKMFGSRNTFLYPKPVSLMKRILQIASQKNSVIMDFFAGSATMGQAVLEYNKKDGGNRSFILITNNENKICSNVSFPRLKKIIEGYTDINNILHEPCNDNLSYHKYEIPVKTKQGIIFKKRKNKN